MTPRRARRSVPPSHHGPLTDRVAEARRAAGVMLIESTYPLGGLTLAGARTASDRPDLLFLHGVTRRWQTFLPLIPPLAARWAVHLADHRGHGGSDRAADGYRVTDYVGDAVELVRTRLDRPFALYGHSLGAMVALAVAAELPRLIRAVVLEDPPFETMGRRIGDSSWPSFFDGLRPFAGDRRPAAEVARDLAEVRVAAPGAAPVRLGDVRDATALRFTAACVKRLDPRALDPIVERRWLDGYDVDRVAACVRCPVLLLQADTAAGGMLTEDDARRVQDAVMDVVRVRFPSAGHVLHWQRADEVLRHTTAFLESLDD